MLQLCFECLSETYACINIECIVTAPAESASKSAWSACIEACILYLLAWSPQRTFHQGPGCDSTEAFEITVSVEDRRTSALWTKPCNQQLKLLNLRKTVLNPSASAPQAVSCSHVTSECLEVHRESRRRVLLGNENSL